MPKSSGYHTLLVLQDQLYTRAGVFPAHDIASSNIVSADDYSLRTILETHNTTDKLFDPGGGHERRNLMWRALSSSRFADKSRAHLMRYVRDNRFPIPSDNEVYLAPGITGIIAESGVGKTQLINTWMRSIGGRTLTWGEPVASMTTSIPPFLHALDLALSQGHRVVYIDALTHLLTRLKGSLGRGGLSQALLAPLSDLNTAAIDRGICLVMNINPRQLPADEVPLMSRSYSGSLTALAQLTSRTGDGVKARWTARFESGREFKDVVFYLNGGAVGTSEPPLSQPSNPGMRHA